MFRSLLSLLFFLPMISLKLSAQDTAQRINQDRRNAPGQQEKPYVILISADGFRHDFADRFSAKNLQSLRAQGVAADYLIPVFPTLTFPNHHSIITGMYPAHHGLVDNNFYDRARGAKYSMGNKKQVADSSWYSGIPLWSLAESQQMLSAAFYWVASESAVGGFRPTYYYPYNEKIAIDQRIKAVTDWLQLPAERRPHLITFYFHQIDHEAHLHGPESPEAGAAVQFVDESIGKLVSEVNKLNLPVNFILVSDHGMTAVDNLHPMRFPAAIDTSKFTVPWGDALVHLYAKDKNYTRQAYKKLRKAADGFDVYLSKNLPKRWHYNDREDRFSRIGDIVLVARPPKIFGFSGTSNPGKHGFDPAIPDMRAVFYCWGPAFKSGLRIAGFENVHIYPLIARMLGLTYGHSIDGRPEVLHGILK